MPSDSPNLMIAELRQALARLLDSDFSTLRDDIQTLQEQLKRVESLSEPLPEDLETLRVALQCLEEQAGQIEQHVSVIQSNLTETQQITGLVRQGLYPALQQDIEADPDLYGEVFGAVISPAIRNQIVNAREDMVAALSPIIGQTISKAMSEAFQDLRRRIDSNMKRSLNLKQQVNRLVARAKGVSDSDLILRESLSYKITHIFLIHRQSGLLIQQVSSGEAAQDTDMISAMLTAIRDFGRDVLGDNEQELEEIQYGESHILLKSGKYAYLAIVIEGVQPSGYTTRMQEVIHEINLKHDRYLRLFDGDMDSLPDFENDLKPLLEPTGLSLESDYPKEEFSSSQRKTLTAGLVGLILLLAFSVFACIFTIRLLPVAFSVPTITALPPTSTSTPTIPPTSTALPTRTFTPLPSPTSTLVPTSTAAVTPAFIKGVMTGDVWIRPEPSQSSKLNQVVVRVNTPVNIVAVYGSWVKISWTSDFGKMEGWVPIQWVGVVDPIPQSIITPAVTQTP